MFAICPAATRVTQGFGCSDYAGEWYAPWCARRRFHAGIDLAADAIHGQPVYATRPGVVVANQDLPHPIVLCPEVGGGSISEPYLGWACVILEVAESGRTVWIEHGHLDAAAVSPGQVVRAGDLLGWVGTHGASCGDHLHVEVRTDGPWQGVAGQAAAVVDPTPYLERLPMLMLDALFPPADPAQLVRDLDAVGAEACLVYCWRPGGVGTWTPAHVAALHAAGKHIVGSVVPLPSGGDVGAQLDAVATMGILPPELVSVDLEPPGLPPASWEEGFDAEARRRGYGDLDYGTSSNLGRYQPDYQEWVARWLRLGVLDPVPELPPGSQAWQFVNDVVVNGSTYDVSVVDPSIFPEGGISMAGEQQILDAVAALQATVNGLVHSVDAVQSNLGTWTDADTKAIRDDLTAIKAQVAALSSAAPGVPHVHTVNAAVTAAGQPIQGG